MGSPKKSRDAVEKRTTKAPKMSERQGAGKVILELEQACLTAAAIDNTARTATVLQPPVMEHTAYSATPMEKVDSRMGASIEEVVAPQSSSNASLPEQNPSSRIDTASNSSEAQVPRDSVRGLVIPASPIIRPDSTTLASGADVVVVTVNKHPVEGDSLKDSSEEVVRSPEPQLQLESQHHFFEHASNHQPSPAAHEEIMRFQNPGGSLAHELQGLGFEQATSFQYEGFGQVPQHPWSFDQQYQQHQQQMFHNQEQGPHMFDAQQGSFVDATNVAGPALMPQPFPVQTSAMFGTAFEYAHKGSDRIAPVQGGPASYPNLYPSLMAQSASVQPPSAIDLTHRFRPYEHGLAAPGQGAQFNSQQPHPASQQDLPICYREINIPCVRPRTPEGYLRFYHAPGVHYPGMQAIGDMVAHPVAQPQAHLIDTTFQPQWQQQEQSAEQPAGEPARQSPTFEDVRARLAANDTFDEAKTTAPEMANQPDCA